MILFCITVMLIINLAEKINNYKRTKKQTHRYLDGNMEVINYFGWRDCDNKGKLINPNNSHEYPAKYVNDKRKKFIKKNGFWL